MSFRERVSKTEVGTVVAAFIVVGGFVYACYTRDAKLVYLIIGSGLTWLYKTKKGE